MMTTVLNSGVVSDCKFFGQCFDENFSIFIGSLSPRDERYSAGIFWKTRQPQAFHPSSHSSSR